MNEVEIDYWNGRVGEKWAALQPQVDMMLAPCTAQLKARAGPVSAQRVLDIGCGTGETCTIWQEAGAEVTGVDVSAPMLAVARERMDGRATLVEADASVWMGHAPFDLAVSRFGLMFFDDPDAAFANVAANLRPGGRLLFTCWRAIEENQWVTLPMGVVRDLTPGRICTAAFSLADPDRLDGLLRRTGFDGITMDRFDFPVCLASEGGTHTAARFLRQVGPTGAALAAVDKQVRAVAEERLTATLVAHERDGQVTLGGAVWMVEAIRQKVSEEAQVVLREPRTAHQA